MSGERLRKTPQSWSEAYRQLTDKHDAIWPKLAGLLDIAPDHFDDLYIRTLNKGDYRVISFATTPEETRKAPRSIRMLFNDLGISGDDKVTVFVELNRDYRRFELGFAPEEIAENKVGVVFRSLGGVDVRGPTKPADVYRLFHGLSTSNHYPFHPFVLEILSEGVDWVTGLILSRKKKVFS